MRLAMRLSLGIIENVVDRYPSSEKRISDQRPMTAPWNGFSTHQDGPFTGQCQKLFNRMAELRRLHIVGVTAKAAVTPAIVDGVFMRMAQAAEAGHPLIPDLNGTQGGGQFTSLELGIMSRSGHGTDIDQHAAFLVLEDAEKYLDRQSGMTYGEHYAGTADNIIFKTC